MSGSDTAAGPTTIHVVPSEARPYQGRPAGLATRMLAGIIDGGVVLLLLVAVYAVWAGALFLWHGRDFRFPSVDPARAIGAGLLIFVGYCTAGWSHAAQTYGGHILGIRVVRPGGDPLSHGIALLRAALVAAFPIGLFWCAISRESRSVQDAIVGTSVIYDWELRPRVAEPAAQRGGGGESRST